MAKGIVIQIQGDGESAKAALQMVRDQMKETAAAAHESGGEIAEAMERVKNVLETVGLYMAVREVISEVRELVAGSLELGETLEQASKKTGLATESLSVLHYGAAILGGDFDGLVTGVARFQRTIGEAADGNKKAQKTMEELGLNAKDLAGRTDGAEIAFHKFISTLAATESVQQRNKLAFDVLGKAGSAQIPVLIELAENWDAMKEKARGAGVLLDSETAAKLADTNQRLEDMKQHALGAGLAFTEGLAPGLSQVFQVITDGKSARDGMIEWGQDISKILAFVASVAYSAAAALEAAFAAGELGRLTKGGSKDMDAARELLKQANEFHDIAFGGPNAPKLGASFLPHTAGGSGAPGFEGGEGGAGGKVKSGNAIAEAAAALETERAKAVADARKVADQVQLAELENQHKVQLVSDETFYAEKLRLQTDEIDVEMDLLVSKQKTLQTLLGNQHHDKTLQPDKGGKSAQELKTQRELVQVGEQLVALDARRATTSSANVTQLVQNDQASRLASLKLAAQLETERNDKITARLALIRYEHEEMAKKLDLNGQSGDAANARALGEVEAKKLEIAQISQRIAAIEEQTKLAVEQQNYLVTQGQKSKAQAAKEINELNRQEAAVLQSVLKQYDAAADVLGGEYLQNAKRLHAELEKLNTPNRKSDAQFTKTLGDGVANMARSISESAILGKQSFSQMAKSIEKDALDLAIKLATQKFLTPALDGAFGGGAAGGGGGFWASLFGAGADHHMSGGDISRPSVVGESGPELFVPKTSGRIVPNNIASSLGHSSGGGKAPSVSFNLVNQSSQPVTAQPGAMNYDADLHSFVQHVVLSDLSTNGPMAQALRPGG